MDRREFKTSLYKEMSGMTKALGNPHRLEILDLLAQGSVPVEYIAVHTNLTIANASQHLQVLKHANLVESDKRGKYNYYKLANRQVFVAWCALRRLGFSQNEKIIDLYNDFLHYVTTHIGYHSHQKSYNIRHLDDHSPHHPIVV